MKKEEELDSYYNAIRLKHQQKNLKNNKRIGDETDSDID
jgi:hypothetical protein